MQLILILNEKNNHIDIKEFKMENAITQLSVVNFSHSLK
jgi:hypothetical protein